MVDRSTAPETVWDLIEASSSESDTAVSPSPAKRRAQTPSLNDEEPLGSSRKGGRDSRSTDLCAADVKSSESDGERQLWAINTMQQKLRRKDAELEKLRRQLRSGFSSAMANEAQVVAPSP